MAAIFTPTIRLSSIYKVFFCVNTIYKDFPESTRDEENEKVEEREREIQYGCKQKQPSNSVFENI